MYHVLMIILYLLIFSTKLNLSLYRFSQCDIKRGTARNSHNFEIPNKVSKISAESGEIFSTNKCNTILFLALLEQDHEKSHLKWKQNFEKSILFSKFFSPVLVVLSGITCNSNPLYSQFSRLLPKSKIMYVYENIVIALEWIIFYSGRCVLDL